MFGGTSPAERQHARGCPGLITGHGHDYPAETVCGGVCKACV